MQTYKNNELICCPYKHNELNHYTRDGKGDGSTGRPRPRLCSAGLCLALDWLTWAAEEQKTMD